MRVPGNGDVVDEGDCARINRFGGQVTVCGLLCVTLVAHVQHDHEVTNRSEGATGCLVYSLRLDIGLLACKEQRH